MQGAHWPAPTSSPPYPRPWAVHPPPSRKHPQWPTIMGNTLTAAHWTEVLGRKRENLGRPRGLCCPESLTFSKWSPRRPQAAVTAVVFPLPGGPRRRTQLVPVSKAPLKPENSHLHPQFCPDLKSQKQTRFLSPGPPCPQPSVVSTVRLHLPHRLWYLAGPGTHPTAGD